LTPGNNLGNGIASFLLGYPGAGLINLRAFTAPQAPFYGWYFQDDFKVTPKFTLNLGFRYDLTLGITERYNQSNFGFDRLASNPIEAQAKAAYARNPIPELPPANFNVKGGLFFATPDNRRNVVADKDNFQPRIGVAYRLMPRTVIRAGFGIFYSAWWQPFVNATGFSAQTDMVASLDGGFTPADTLANPFPNGLTQPTGSSLGLRTLLGQSLSPYDYSRKDIRNDRWSFGFQQELFREIQFEVNYVGQRAPNLIASTSASDAGRVINGGWNGTGGGFDQRNYGLGTRLNARVPNPFLGLIPQPSQLAGATVTVAQLLEPHPSFGNINLNRSPGGTSRYHSLQVSGQKRYSHGLSFTFAYTFSKQTEKLRYIEPSDPEPSNMIGQFDNPHRFSSAIIYDFPFGAGKMQTGLKVVDVIIGGWQWSSMFIYQTGPAVGIPSIRATGVSPKINEPEVDRWFNPVSMAVLPAFTARRVPFFWTDLRQDSINNWDIGILKNTMIRERYKLQFRFEMINAFNHVWFGAPDTGVTSATYTRVRTQANQPRTIQLGLKLSY
jgi:hypothetical protein